MPEYHPSIADARTLAARGLAVPIARRLLADQLTPVGAFQRIAHGAERAFLLESVTGGEHVARYSFVGAWPMAVFRARGHAVSIERPDGSVEVPSAVADPLGVLERLLAEYRTVRREQMPPGPVTLPRFVGGAVGFAAYDAVRYTERLPNAPRDDRGIDDLEFGIYDAMTVFDHVNNTVLVIAHTRPDAGGFDAGYADACRRIDDLVDRLNRPRPEWAADLDLDAPPAAVPASTLTRAAFEDVVRRAIEYVRAGDIFQVVLSQRLRAESAADPLDIYRALRVVNPSPFMFFLRGPRCTLVGASPEILCRVEDGIVTNRPLAGTRRRGATPQEDEQLERELLADPKDRAEHIMLVDLGRNDVGRVCAAGSVALREVMTVERYSHVMHISSTVDGRLADGRTAMDALRAALPAGTVSGAPKVRAMEIIDELEPVRRGPYGGAVGYLDFSGNLDTCIALRTLVVTPAGTPPTPPEGGAGGRPILANQGWGQSGRWNVDVQVGAGIVADSDPAAEYEETINKARAQLAAIAIAEPRASETP